MESTGLVYLENILKYIFNEVEATWDFTLLKVRKIFLWPQKMNEIFPSQSHLE